jgi:glycosyltransferase involved in cell wall biosynthesis
MQSEPIKILYVIDSYSNPYAGTEGQLFQLIKHLDRKLFTPKLLVFTQSKWLNENEFPCPVEVLGYSSIKSPITWLALIRKAKKYKKEGIKIAHVYFNDASVICPPVFRLMSIRCFISRRDMGYWYTRLYKFLLPITGKFTCGVIVNSNAVGEVAHQVEKIPKNKISTIYNGFELSTEPVKKVDQLGEFKQQSILFVLVANIRPIKRIEDAITALSRLQEHDAKLVIIGGGDVPAPLQQLAKKLNIAERVLFLGSRNDIRDCLEYADVGLLCSESEGFSNAIVEYQFSRLPVVCSKVGGNPEAIIEKKNGLLYEACNVDELTSKLSYLLDNPSLIKEFGNTAYQNAKQNYSVNAMISAHYNLYKNTLTNINK